MRRAGEELAALLVPEILRRTRRMRRRYESLSRRLSTDLSGGGDAFEPLERAGEETRRLGWCLGVLGAAVGANALVARREAEGLRFLGEILEGALARRGMCLEPPARLWPRLAGTVGEGWELALLAAALGADGARVVPLPGPLRWRLAGAGDRRRFELRVAAPLEALEGSVRALAPRLPGLAWERSAGWVGFSVPREWLDDAPGGEG